MQTRCFQIKAREAEAIKAGRQTRFLRTLNATPPQGTHFYFRNLSAQTFMPSRGLVPGVLTGPAIECPYGRIDDLLWCKYVTGQDEQQKPVRNTRADTDIWLRITNVELYHLSTASRQGLLEHGIQHYLLDGEYCLPIGSGTGGFRTADPAIAVQVRHELTYDLDADLNPFVWMIDVVPIEPPTEG